MDCKKVKDLVFTDYFDQQMADLYREELENHFNQCAKCSDLANELKQMMAQPFGVAQAFTPPERVWHKIKETLESRRKKQLVASWWLGLKESFAQMPAAFAAPFAVILLLLVILPQQPLSQHHVGTGYYLYETLTTSSREGLGLEDPEEDDGFGSLIEEFFM